MGGVAYKRHLSFTVMSDLGNRSMSVCFWSYLSARKEGGKTTDETKEKKIERSEKERKKIERKKDKIKSKKEN